MGYQPMCCGTPQLSPGTPGESARAKRSSRGMGVSRMCCGTPQLWLVLQPISRKRIALCHRRLAHVLQYPQLSSNRLPTYLYGPPTYSSSPLPILHFAFLVFSFWFPAFVICHCLFVI